MFSSLRGRPLEYGRRAQDSREVEQNGLTLYALQYWAL